MNTLKGGLELGITGHRAGGEETDSTGQFRVPKSSERRREDGERERGTSKSIGRSERLESS